MGKSVLQIKFLFFVLILIVLVSCQQSNPQTTTGETKEFNTAISDYAYSPSSITVNLGDKVIIHVTNNDPLGHGFSLQQFGISELIKPGETKTIQFVASKRGAPSSFCSAEHGEKLEVRVV